MGKLPCQTYRRWRAIAGQSTPRVTIPTWIIRALLLGTGPGRAVAALLREGDRRPAQDDAGLVSHTREVVPHECRDPASQNTVQEETFPVSSTPGG
jgi:hypothetical protein